MKHVQSRVAVAALALLVLTALAYAGAAFLPKDVTFVRMFTMHVGTEQKPFYFTAVTQTFTNTVTNLTWSVLCDRGGGPPDVLLDVTVTNVNTVTWNVEKLIGRYWFRRDDDIIFSNNVPDRSIMTFSAETE